MVFIIIVMNIMTVDAFTWDDCIKKYEKAKQFQEHTRLSYTYLRFTKSCLIKFKNILVQQPNPEFTVKAMSNNIRMLDNHINNLMPKYSTSKNTLEQIPKYINNNTTHPIPNKEYSYFKRFKNCNGIHANDKIYTAKHCKIKESKNVHYDLNYIQSNTHSKLKVSKLDLSKKGTLKYYSMSQEGMYYRVLLKEKNCTFYKAKNLPTGLNTTLDNTDLEKEEEIRSNCLAIPSNSGGGAFQEGKLVGIISKTVFNDKEFLYSVIEPIIPISH